MSSQTWWLVARASGITAWAALSGSTIAGLLLTTRPAPSRPGRPWLLDVHRTLGGICCWLVGLHLIAVVADSYESFTAVNLLVPFTVPWNGLAFDLGVVSLYLLAAVEVTSLYQQRLPRRAWRLVHHGGFVLFWTVTAHGLLAGSDTTGALLFTTQAATAAVVATLSLYRLVAWTANTSRSSTSVADWSDIQ